MGKSANIAIAGIVATGIYLYADSKKEEVPEGLGPLDYIIYIGAGILTDIFVNEAIERSAKSIAKRLAKEAYDEAMKAVDRAKIKEFETAKAYEEAGRVKSQEADALRQELENDRKNVADLEEDAKAKEKEYNDLPEDEAEAKRWEEEEQARKADEEAKRIADEEARVKAEAEEKARIEAEEKSRIEAEEKARVDAENAQKARMEAEEKARIDAENARIQAEEKARLEADAKAKADAEAKARIDADNAEKAHIEADAKAKADAEAKLKAEAEAKIKHDEDFRKRGYDDVDSGKNRKLRILEEEVMTLEERAIYERGVAEAIEKIGFEKAEEIAAKAGARASKFFNKAVVLLEGPLGWIIFGLSTGMVVVLGLDPTMFEECKEGWWDPSKVFGDADWANKYLIDDKWITGNDIADFALNAVPFLGDFFSVVEGYVCVKAGECPPAYPEMRIGLCYKRCPEGFKADVDTFGWFCWKDYGPYWENKTFPASPTTTSITHSIETNTGFPRNTCNPGDTWDGAGLCYGQCKEGYHNVAGVCWADYSYVSGRIPDKKGCDEFQREEGWNNSRDDGTSCWEDLACNTNCSGDWWNPGSWHCDTNCGGCACIKKALWERQKCNADEDLIDGLCYQKCPAGKDHIAGLPMNCSPSSDLSYYNAYMPHCPEGSTEDSVGLCYPNPQEGFHKTTLGLKADDCPTGATDFGVGCIRELKVSPNGVPPIQMYVKERTSYYGDFDAGTQVIPTFPTIANNACSAILTEEMCNYMGDEWKTNTSWLTDSAIWKRLTDVHFNL